MRHLTGVGTPRSLQGRASALVEALIGLLSGCWGRVRRVWAPERHEIPLSASLLGDTNEVALRLEVDRTFVPAQLPHLDNPDTRALGVRVLGVYLAGATTAQRGDL